MRILKFIVEDQFLKPDPNCVFDGLVPGGENNVRVQFDFSTEWNNTKKVVSFWSRLGKELTPMLLDGRNMCDIPEEALKGKYFKLQVIGKKNDGPTIVTNRFEICQNGG